VLTGLLFATTTSHAQNFTPYDLSGDWLCERGAIPCKIEQNGTVLRFSHAQGASDGRIIDASHVEGWGDVATISLNGDRLTWRRGDVWVRR